MCSKLLLSDIKSPAALQGLGKESLEDLAKQIRKKIIETVQKNGGHLASNLGVVELTLALHICFRTPEDKIVWDVGHQCYTHKLLTGRYSEFINLRKKDGLSGFPKREESLHDAFNTGHSSTSISAGLGLLEAMSKMGKPGKVICVIGDGALTGGMALEALNYAGHQGKGLIIILNDNEMSISRNVGAISSYLSRLASTEQYESLVSLVKRICRFIPFLGKPLYRFYCQIKRGLKGFLYKETWFTELGLKYVGPIDGHDIQQMKKVFNHLGHLEKPVVVHVLTKKGKGHTRSEDDPSSFHGVSPRPEEMEDESNLPDPLTVCFGNSLLKEAEANDSVVAITAAMESGTGLAPFHKKYPDRFYDVGITEQHAVTFAAGMAAAGLRPVVAVYSTFMQRAVDQFIHDVAIPQLPVTIVMDRAGLVPLDGETHQGIFDIALFKGIPGITFLSPATAVEMEMMLKYSLELESSSLIRYPKQRALAEIPGLEFKLEKGRGIVVNKKENATVLIMTLGGLLDEAVNASRLLEEKKIIADVYNIRFIAPLDTDYLQKLVSEYKYVLILEDGVERGGIGETIASVLNSADVRIPVKIRGIDGTFPSQATRKELKEKYGLDSQAVAFRVEADLQGYRFKEVVEQVKNDTWKAAYKI